MLAALLLGSALCAPGQASSPPPPDPLQPSTAVDPVAASPLRRVTVITDSLPTARRFYVEGLGMRVLQSSALSRAEARRMKVPTVAQTVTLARTEIADAATVRLVTVPRGRPMLRPTHNALALGGLAMGMPVAGQAQREAILTAAGFRSAVGVTSMTLPRGDGSKYTVEEIHYQGPDGVLVLGIDRGTMTPVGPVDAASGIGGPAYASLVVEDLPRTEAFLKTVLRYEKRRDAVFSSSGLKGGLGLAEGQRFAFQQWYAPGATTGYLVIMKMLDRPEVSRAMPGFTTRGIAIWTFEAVDLDDVAARAESVGMRIFARPENGAPSLIVVMPDGFLVEFVKRGSAS
jgi:catechol 2,3-dioxygenase-like lactoylglutathione lyase family enzyme